MSKCFKYSLEKCRHTDISITSFITKDKDIREITVFCLDCCNNARGFVRFESGN